jgi:hypothetical protein
VKLRDFRFKDIQFAGGICKSLLRASADNVAFENIRDAGRPATANVDLKLTLAGEIRNLRYLPAAK